jgi:hypothetical protein
VLHFCSSFLSISVRAQQYDFSSIDQLLDDSSALYLNRIYVEVFQDDSSIYKYQSGNIFCNNIRIPQGSATKWISAGIMLKLAELGWWNLDDSIGMYLPQFTQYGKGHITLRQSYSLSSGMFNPGNSNDYHRMSSLTLEQSVDSIAQNVDILYPTGQMIGYDGTMMHVWGRAAEVVDSLNGNIRDWRTIAKEEFFDLLFMDSTDYTDFLPNPAVAGGIETTPCDYLKFLKMISNDGWYNGSQILQPSSIDEIFTDQTSSAPIYYTFWPNNHPDFPIGLDTLRYTFGGWWLELDNQHNITTVCSPGAFGHYPFVDRCRNMYGTFFCFIPAFQGGAQNVMDTYLKFMHMVRDTVDSQCLLTTSTPESQRAELVYFPNPTKDHIIIQSKRNVASVQVYSLTGQIVLEQSFPEIKEIQLNSSNWVRGIYLVSVTQSDGKSELFKIIKQ